MSDWFGIVFGLVAIACLLAPAGKAWFEDWDQPEADDHG